MEYLVLGGNGFIGSFVVDEILANGHNVTVLDMGPEKFRSPLSNVKYVTGSIDNLELLNETFEGKDILIHSVSTTVPYTSNQNIQFDIESNLISSVNIFRIAAEKGIKRIVYLSSGGAVYGEPITVPIPENHPMNPLSSYGITKLAIEKYLSYFSINYGIEYNIIRPSNPYGPRQNPFSNQGVIAVFLGKVLKDEVIEVWGDGTIAKDYVYIKDIASAIYKSSITDKVYEAYNIGSGDFVSLNEIIEIIRDITYKDVKFRYMDSNKFDVHKVCLDINKAKRELDFEPRINLKQGIKETWDFIKLQYL